MRILLADDEPISRQVAEMALCALGHQVETVTDGSDAWDAYRRDQPDVVISDWTMPGLSGLQLCRNIRNDPGAYTYIILLTGHGATEQIVQGMTAGADDYLMKPLNTDALEVRLIAARRVTSLHRELADQRRELERLNGELTAIARRDPLTGLGNRLALEEDMVLVEARVSRYGHQYCMALFDIDHFKPYNDTYGHQEGDAVIQIVARELNRQARQEDSLYRYGGEEFLCIFPEQSLANGMMVAERMRASLQSLDIAHVGSISGAITISAGMAVLDPARTRSVFEVLKEADQALYQAKKLGRNRVEQRLVVGQVTAAGTEQLRTVVSVAQQ